MMEGIESMGNSNTRTNIHFKNNLLQQIDYISGYSTIANIKIRGVLLLLILIVISGLCINISVKLLSCPNKKYLAVENNDTWSLNDAKLNKTYENCSNQYDIGSNIIVSHCNNSQFGKIVDIRIFLNGKPTIKGIAVPNFVAHRLFKAIFEVK